MTHVTVVFPLKITHPLKKVYTATISGWYCLTNFCKKYYSIFSTLYRGGHAVWYKYVCIYIKLRLSDGFQPFHSSICKYSGFLLFFWHFSWLDGRWPMQSSTKQRLERIGKNGWDWDLVKVTKFYRHRIVVKMYYFRTKLWFQMLFHLILVLSLSQI